MYFAEWFFFYIKHWFEYLTAPCFSFVEHCAWLEAVVRSLSDIRVIKCILLSDREKKSGVNCTRWIYIVFGFELFPHIDSSPSNFDTYINRDLFMQNTSIFLMNYIVGIYSFIVV